LEKTESGLADLQAIEIAKKPTKESLEELAEKRAGFGSACRKALFGLAASDTPQDRLVTFRHARAGHRHPRRDATARPENEASHPGEHGHDGEGGSPRNKRAIQAPMTRHRRLHRLPLVA